MCGVIAFATTGS